MQIGRVQANRYLAFTGFTICFLFLLASSPSHCLGEGRVSNEAAAKRRVVEGMRVTAPGYC